MNKVAAGSLKSSGPGMCRLTRMVRLHTVHNRAAVVEMPRAKEGGEAADHVHARRLAKECARMGKEIR